MKRDDGPTYEDVVQEILTAAGGPVAVDKLVDEVLARKATVSKNPRQLVRNKLREFIGRVLVYLNADHVLAVPLAYKGARFRIRLDHASINQGTISAENFEYYLPHLFEIEKIQLVDSAGSPIPFQIKTTFLARGKKHVVWCVHGRKNMGGAKRVVPPAEDVS